MTLIPPDFLSSFEIHEGKNPFFVNTKAVIGNLTENAKIYGEITIPKNWSGPNRKIVLLQWGLWQTHQRQSSALPTFLKQQLLNNNIAVVTIDPLGLDDPEIGGKSTGGNQSNYSMPQLAHDATEVVKALAKLDSLGLTNLQDRTQLFILGVSIGGATAVWSADQSAKENIKVDGVITLGAPENLRTMWNSYFSEDKGERVKRLDKNDPSDAEFLRRGFLYKYLGADSTVIPVSMNIHLDSEQRGMERVSHTITALPVPVICFGSRNDRIAPFSMLKDNLLKRTSPTSIVEIADVNHNFERADGNIWDQVYRHIQTFLNNPESRTQIGIN